MTRAAHLDTTRATCNTGVKYDEPGEISLKSKARKLNRQESKDEEIRYSNWYEV